MRGRRRQVREAHGLYVLGTERHRGRTRIDNELRGRARTVRAIRARPVLPVARRRADATGRHWRHRQMVMGKTGPKRCHRVEDGVQGHRTGSEHRRAAQRRDPQERAPERRGHERAAQGDLPTCATRSWRAPTSVSRSASTWPRRSTAPCRQTPGDDCVEEWDVDGLLIPRSTRSGRPAITADQVKEPHCHDELYDLLMTDATGHYAERGEELGTEAMRDRASGDARHHRRAAGDATSATGLPARRHRPPGLGQTTRAPSGSVRASTCSKSCAQLGPRVRQEHHARPDRGGRRPAGGPQRAVLGPEDPSRPVRLALAIGRAQFEAAVAVWPSTTAEPEQQKPIVKSDLENTGRNDPCPVRIGKKFKQCHGAG